MSDNAAIVIAFVVLAALVATAVYLIVRIAGGVKASGGKTVVRCAAGHLFTTVWIPGISFKAIRLGFMRIQYCPVGDHWALVRPVDPRDLNQAERRFAARHHDRDIP